MSTGAIHFEGVWKSYPRWGLEGPGTLREALRRRIPGQAVPRERRWALRDVSCSFASGVATGIVGQNGAGKSTMLRLASGVGAATRGRILLPENTASVLNLGYVFDATLTGAENGFTAALMAGMSAAQARAVQPAVMEFAELEAFTEAPLRTYSDGMKLRLAFGVIAQLRPDALLLDEVMAVGDLRFQAKCLARIDEMRDDGTTVVFASHGLEQVVDQCDRAIWLDGGVIRLHADADEVVDAYRKAMESETIARTPSVQTSGAGDDLELGRNRLGSQEVTIDAVDISVTPASGADGATTVAVGLAVTAPQPIRAPIAVVTVRSSEDGLVCIDLSSEGSGVSLSDLEGSAEIGLRLDDVRLAPGDYVVDVGIYERTWSYAYDLHLGAYRFTLPGVARGHGLYHPRHAWELSDR